MSDMMLIETIGVHKLIERWNHGPFERFQVKGMEYGEMIGKIVDVMSCNHAVTDYSSFEASITSLIRGLEHRVLTSLCKRAGFSNTLRALEKWNTRARKLKSKWGTFVIQSRCSGDPWTSMGNGIVNMCLIAYMAKSKGVKDLRKLDVVVEGDDGLIPIKYLATDVSESLGFELSSNFIGSRAGDNDFLRSLWFEGRRYLNIGRVLSSLLWVKNASHLKVGKQLWLLRCMAASIYYLSPGHPVLTSLINFISRKTARILPFKNYLRYLDLKGQADAKFTGIPKHIEICVEMRDLLSRGGNGVPPVSIATQLELEERFSKGEFYIGNLLNDNPEIVERSVLDPAKTTGDTMSFKQLIDILGAQIEVKSNWDVVN